MTQKDRMTFVWDEDVRDGVYAQRARPEDARKSIGKIINELLREAMEKRSKEKTA